MWLGQVNIHCKEISKVIQELAYKKGWVWADRLMLGHFNEIFPYLLFWQSSESDDRKLYHNNKHDTRYGTLMTIEQTIDFLSSLKKTIKIDKYVVFFRKERIQVGCQTISREKVKEIYDRLNN